MDDARFFFDNRTATRRGFLVRLHCTALVAAAAAVGTPAAVAAGKTLLVVGNSLSAEYGLARGTGWVALLEQKLAREKIAVRVINASISGDTTSGGRARLPALLAEHRPTHVIIELGGNDALRGLPLDSTRANLAEMARASRGAGATVLIAGMQMPPNYGKRYADDFAALFANVAKAESAALVPFILKGIADGPQALRLFQPDRIHPTEEAQPEMLDNVWPVLAPLLK